ncbi:MAG: NAD-dependent epimerase/dehydratase family protein, partial [Oscillospiraceae bacterium]
MGHLGNTIVKELLANGETVRALALSTDKTLSLDANENLSIFKGDVCDKSSLEPLFCNAANDKLVCIHSAGIVSIASHTSARLREVNVRGTQNIIDLCTRYCVSKLVYVSSVHAITEKPNDEMIFETTSFNPDEVTGGYAKTKAEATRRVLLAAANGLNAVVVHPSGIIGPGDYGQAHLTQLIMDYLDGRLTACVKGAYDFVDVRDVAQGCIAAANVGKSGDCYILSGHRCSVKDLLDILSTVSGRKPIKTMLPLWFANFTAPLAEKYYNLR